MRIQYRKPNPEQKLEDEKGFTLIELMAVVAIVSILAVIAMPAYLDYVVRSKVVEGVTFAAEAKTTVSEYYYSNGYVMPQGNLQAGLPAADNYNTFDYVSRVEITTAPRPGTIEITFKIDGLGPDNLLHFVPATVDNLVSWTCIPPADNGITRSRVPPNCRGI
jgi:type IV pilus assembly protein PilA